MKVCAYMKIVPGVGKCYKKLDIGDYVVFYQTMEHDEIYAIKRPVFFSGYNH